MAQLELNARKRTPLLKSQTHHLHPEPQLPTKKIHHHHHHSQPLPSEAAKEGEGSGDEGRLYWIGNATTVLEWRGVRILTDPNFLHAGDHVHLGPGVTAERLKDPAVDIDALPPLDCILLSHYHEDHFDKLVEESLNRKFPIISTPHAKAALESKDEPFTAVYGLDVFESLCLVPSTTGNGTGVRMEEDGNGKNTPVIKITGTPGKHVPPGPLSIINDILGAVPPTNGWLIEMGFVSPNSSPATAQAGPGSELDLKKNIIDLKKEDALYRIYISGDTLFVDELSQIRTHLEEEKINLMIVHLGGTTIPSPKAPLFMVTMDGKQGVKLMRLLDPEVTIPVHFDDYDVMVSGLEDFLRELDAVDSDLAGQGDEGQGVRDTKEDEGKEGEWKVSDGKEKEKGRNWRDRVVVLGRGEEYRFRVGSHGVHD